MKRDVYAAITGRILDALQQGVVPWHKPWDARQGRPRNLVSGKPYRGMNVWILAGQGGSPFWLTYRQAQQIGGHVKQGERGNDRYFLEMAGEETGDGRRRRGDRGDDAPRVCDATGIHRVQRLPV